MNKETLENDAHLAVKEEYDIDYADEKPWIQGYIAGATAQHPKAWNEAIEAVLVELDGMAERSLNIDYEDAYNLAKECLQKLKLDPKQE